MFCSNCGENLPDGANFCLKCGKSQIQGAQLKESKWETCEIIFKVTYDGITETSGYFRAEAIGIHGIYEAGKSKEFGCGYNMSLPDSKNASHLNSLIEILVKDGWEPTGARGEHWWNNRFRRKAEEPSADWDTWEECEIKTSYVNPTLFSTRNIFVAVAIGRTAEMDKVKILAKSPPFNYKQGDLTINQAQTKPVVQEAFREFVEQLQKEGWEPKNTCGKYWTQQQFRRKIK